MTITIEPYTINLNFENSEIPITYWGIYLNDKNVLELADFEMRKQKSG